MSTEEARRSVGQQVMGGGCPVLQAQPGPGPCLSEGVHGGGTLLCGLGVGSAQHPSAAFPIGPEVGGLHNGPIL